MIFSQAAHQIDIVRLLGGGRVRSVRAMTGAWDAARPTEGAYSALLTFEDGTFASVTYSGYAHFDSDELTNWIGEMGLPKDQSRYGAARKALRAAPAGAGSGAESRAQFRRQGLRGRARSRPSGRGSTSISDSCSCPASAPTCARSRTAS